MPRKLPFYTKRKLRAYKARKLEELRNQEEDRRAQQKLSKEGQAIDRVMEGCHE